MIQTESNQSPCVSNSSPVRTGSEPDRYDGMVSSFTIKTSKPWTYVNVHEDKGMGRSSRHAGVRSASLGSSPPYTTSPASMMSSGGPIRVPRRQGSADGTHKWTNVTGPGELSRKRSSGDADTTPRKGLTFHCLEFQNGSLRQVSRTPSSSDASAGIVQTTFIPSEYQERVSPPLPGPKMEQPALEAAQILLDFTRSAQ